MTPPHRDEAGSSPAARRGEGNLDVAVVGGGPVGLYLGCRLAALGLQVRVLEKGLQPRAHSRSIGIHPPSLELFEEIGVAEQMLARGVRVGRGRAIAGRKPLGVLDFSVLGGRYPFVLTLPQPETEAILEKRLLKLAPEALLRGAEVVGLEAAGDGVTLRWRQGASEAALAARFVVGADGRHSAVRHAAGLDYRGWPYPDSYLMGDFADTTDLGTDAAIYLTPEGLVESFPLPRGLRRWVVKTERLAEGATAEELCDLVSARLGYLPPAESNTMLSAFRPERQLASRFAWGRLVLAGDAAHVLSPIGGQGMNLGWQDAAVLSDAFVRIFEDAHPHAQLFALYERRRRAAALRAARQAEVNMALGRKTRLTVPRNALVWTMLNTPLQRRMARTFTMAWL